MISSDLAAGTLSNKNEQWQPPITSLISGHQKCCLLLIFGLPAAGKSNLARRIQQMLNNYEALEKEGMKSHYTEHLACYLISIDKLMSVSEQAIAIKESGAWRRFRRNVLLATQLFIKQLILINSRNESVEGCNNVNLTDANVRRIYEAIVADSNNAFATNKENFVIIIDDNLYYRSMRYEWCQVARQVGFGFAQIFIDCPLEVAILRNNDRSEYDKLPDDVIITMHRRLEKPDLKGFEEQTLVLDERRDVADHEILYLIRDAIDNYAKYLQDIDTLREEKRAENHKKSLIHQVDCALREIIHEEIKDASVKERQRVAITLSRAKQSFLMQMRNSKLLLPEQTQQDLLRDEALKCETKLFLKALLLRLQSSESLNPV